MEGGTISGNLGIESLLDEGSPLDLGLSLLDLGHDAVDVLQFVAALPENLGVLHDLVLSLALDLLGNVFDVVAAVLLVQADELVEVALGPVGETLMTEGKKVLNEMPNNSFCILRQFVVEADMLRQRQLNKFAANYKDGQLSMGRTERTHGSVLLKNNIPPCSV